MVEDILKRYGDRMYKFSDGTKIYGLRVTQIVSCTVEELQIQVKDKGYANYTLLVDKSNRSFLLNGNNRIPMKPTRDDKEIWKEMIHCLFKYAYNKSKGIGENKDINCNRNMNKKLIRLTESDLHRIVRESMGKILKEDFSGFAETEMESNAKNDFLELKSMFDGHSFNTVKMLLTPYITQVDKGNELFDFEFKNNVMTILNKNGKAVVSADVDSHNDNDNWQSFDFWKGNTNYR